MAKRGIAPPRRATSLQYGSTVSNLTLCDIRKQAFLFTPQSGGPAARGGLGRRPLMRDSITELFLNVAKMVAFTPTERAREDKTAR